MTEHEGERETRRRNGRRSTLSIRSIRRGGRFQKTKKASSITCGDSFGQSFPPRVVGTEYLGVTDRLGFRVQCFKSI